MSKQNENNPLVSVAVVTYNSSATIIETLDSIAAQTYQNIELVVSDDCSPDNTVEIVRAWMNEHRDRFVRCELVTTDKNTGPSGNYNRVRNACKGKWIKDMDGDDMLFPKSISKYVTYVSKHPEADYIFAREHVLSNNPDRIVYVNGRHIYEFFTWSRQKQLDFLTLHWNCLPNVTAFWNREKVIAKGIVNDERIPMLEDHPKWINVVNSGCNIQFIDEELVIYRLSDTSLSTNITYSKVFVKSLKRMFWLYQFKPMREKWGLRYTLYHYCCYCIEKTNATGWKIARKLCKILGFKKSIHPYYE